MKYTNFVSISISASACIWLPYVDQVRLSLHEILENLENKDLQLRLAMQDISIATREIKMAAEMRRKLQLLTS